MRTLEILRVVISALLIITSIILVNMGFDRIDVPVEGGFTPHFLFLMGTMAAIGAMVAIKWGQK